MLKGLRYIILLLIIGTLGFVLAYNLGVNAPVSGAGKDTVFIVSPGEGVEKIGQNLFDAGLINSRLYFKIYVWRSGIQSDLKAGEYMLKTSLSIKEIASILVSGESLSREKEIKIIEGWKINDIEEYLVKNNLAPKNTFNELAKHDIGYWILDIAKPDFLNDAPADANLEGYLFPDTYRIFRDATAEDIIAKMLDNFNGKLSPAMRADISKQGKSIHDIVVMSSIVEKEVRSAADKKIVAGILYKRLELGMKLEVDVTINYISGKNNPSSALEDLQIDSPYNTYKYYGLPPGPIANPGLDAIMAAIYPEKSPYLFYLNRQDTGETIFSKTYEEHLRNKAKYLK